LARDKIVKGYKQTLIVNTGGVIQIFHPKFAARFMVNLDDSKTSGRRKSLGVSYEEQLEAGHQLADFTFQGMNSGLLGLTDDDHS